MRGSRGGLGGLPYVQPVPKRSNRKRKIFDNVKRSGGPKVSPKVKKVVLEKDEVKEEQGQNGKVDGSDAVENVTSKEESHVKE